MVTMLVGGGHLAVECPLRLQGSDPSTPCLSGHMGVHEWTYGGVVSA